MTLDVKEAARIAQSAGRQTVQDAMEVRRRSSPWEVTEAWLKISILQAFLSAIREMPKPHLRVFDELAVDKIINLPPPRVDDVKQHPFDLVLLHPLDTCADGNCAWDKKHQAAFGLIEVKKLNEIQTLLVDVDLLSYMAKPTGECPLGWVLLVVFINGKSKDAVHKKDSGVKKKVEGYGLTSFTSCDPKEAPLMPGGDVDDRWFDVTCYGKVVSPGFVRAGVSFKSGERIA